MSYKKLIRKSNQGLPFFANLRVDQAYAVSGDK
jgi:hypothetical protein